MKSLNAMIPGSFDPPTIGHLDIIKRASELCEKLFVVIAVNPEKKYFLSALERLEILKQLLSEYRNIEVCIWDGLVVDFASENDVKLIFRGIRNLDDFKYEKELEKAYKKGLENIEVSYLFASEKYSQISSTQVKKTYLEGKDISFYVPKEVQTLMDKKSKQLT